VAELSGASVVDASGRTDGQVVHASGASDYHAADLTSTVRVRERLVVDASGGSALEYVGDPALTLNASGGSLVRPVGD
jgi:hypothetical protein